MEAASDQRNASEMNYDTADESDALQGTDRADWLVSGQVAGTRSV
jgi:hypothetical protein